LPGFTRQSSSPGIRNQRRQGFTGFRFRGNDEKRMRRG
jgi:hypothetical protein